MKANNNQNILAEKLAGGGLIDAKTVCLLVKTVQLSRMVAQSTSKPQRSRSREMPTSVAAMMNCAFGDRTSDTLHRT